MAKVVYNNCFGGFSFSKKARDWLAERGLPEAVEDQTIDPNCTYNFRPYKTPRHSKLLVQCVEELGKEANGDFADLQIKVVNSPYRIDEYDGNEQVMTSDTYDWINPDET